MTPPMSTTATRKRLVDVHTEYVKDSGEEAAAGNLKTFVLTLRRLAFSDRSNGPIGAVLCCLFRLFRYQVHNEEGRGMYTKSTNR